MGNGKWEVGMGSGNGTLPPVPGDDSIISWATHHHPPPPYGYVIALCRVELELQTLIFSLRASAPFQKRKIKSLSSTMRKSKILELFKLYFFLAPTGAQGEGMLSVCLYMRACVRACVRACMRALLSSNNEF